MVSSSESQKFWDRLPSLDRPPRDPESSDPRHEPQW